MILTSKHNLALWGRKFYDEWEPYLNINPIRLTLYNQRLLVCGYVIEQNNKFFNDIDNFSELKIVYRSCGRLDDPQNGQIVYLIEKPKVTRKWVKLNDFKPDYQEFAITNYVELQGAITEFPLDWSKF